MELEVEVGGGGNGGCDGVTVAVEVEQPGSLQRLKCWNLCAVSAVSNHLRYLDEREEEAKNRHPSLFWWCLHFPRRGVDDPATLRTAQLPNCTLRRRHLPCSFGRDAL